MSSEQRLVDLCFKLAVDCIGYLPEDIIIYVRQQLWDEGFPTVQGKLRPRDLRFQVGRFYEHSSGDKIHVLESLLTTMWRQTLVVEVAGGELRAVGSDSASAENYHEITYARWMGDFDV